MGIEYSVRPFDGEIARAYLDLFPEDRDRKQEALLHWRFGDTPQGRGQFGLAVDDGRIVGMIGLIPVALQAGRDTRPAFQAVDTIVDPAYRGRGLFGGMGTEIQNHPEVHGAEVLWGFPNASAARGWFGRMAWDNFGEVPFLFRPLQAGYFLKRAISALGRVKLPLYFGRGEPNRQIDRLDQRAQSLVDAFAARFAVGQRRSVEWLNWRLFDKPAGDYRVYTHGDRDIDALLAVAYREKHGGRVLYVMEAMSKPSADDALKAMIEAELGQATRAGCDVALAWAPPGAPNRAILRSAGLVTLPRKLRPIELNFGARLMTDNAPAAAREGENWYLSYLDSDTV